MALEREYNVPLRREWLKVPKYKRAKKAVVALKQFLSKHMKSENIKLGKHVNEQIWGKGMRNPPHHVKVTAVKDDEGNVTAELTGIKLEAPEAPSKENPVKKAVEKRQENLTEDEKKVVEAKSAEDNALDKAKETKKENKEVLKDTPKPKPESKVEAKEEKGVKDDVKAAKPTAK